MLRFLFSTGIFLFPLHIFSSSLHDYIYPKQQPSYSNYGTTGLIQMPSARFHEPGSLGLSWSHNDPYIRGSVIAYPFSWLEASYGYTDINNALYSNVESFSGDQSYKDKGFDVKIKLLNESQYLPSIAMGVRDLAGSGTFEGEYLALSKLYKNIDFTIGAGWGDLSHGAYSKPFNKN